MKYRFHLTSISAFIIGMILLTSCMDGREVEVEDAQKRWESEVKSIDEYLTTNNKAFLKDVNGIRIVLTDTGTALPANYWDSVSIDYTGKLFPSGSTFGQGSATEYLTTFIPGWIIAFSSIPQGSKGTVYIPSYYGYGPAGQGSIPGNAILSFDFNFKTVKVVKAVRDKLKTDTVAIDQYLEQKNIENVVKDKSGVRYVVTVEGTGDYPSLLDEVHTSYKIKALTNDQTVLQSVEIKPTDNANKRVANYIHGLNIGLRKLKKGSKATFYIPSSLAFGSMGYIKSDNTTVVPPNTNIIVELEFIDILR